ncbi:MAG: hypothetical protein ACI9ZH_002025 [Paracoccaceae bacterium]|jgi:hypothetical protein
MTGFVSAPIGAGDLIDRITILALKAERFEAPARRNAALHALSALTAARDAATPSSAALDALTADLFAVNAALWDIENALRAHEARGDFGAEFVALARSVYHRNDRRAAIKRAISTLCDDPLAEDKEHPAY